MSCVLRRDARDSARFCFTAHKVKPPLNVGNSEDAPRHSAGAQPRSHARASPGIHRRGRLRIDHRTAHGRVPATTDSSQLTIVKMAEFEHAFDSRMPDIARASRSRIPPAAPRTMPEWLVFAKGVHAELAGGSTGILHAEFTNCAKMCPNKGVGKEVTKLLSTTGIPERDICKRVLAKLSNLFNQLVDEYGAEANSPGGQPAARSAAAGVAGEGVGAKDRGAEARSLAQHSPASPPPPPFCSPLPPPGTVGARLEPQRQESDDRTPAGAGQPPAGARGGGTTCGASDPHNAQPKVNAAEQAPVAFIEDEHARAGAATPMSSAEGDEGEASRQEALGCGGSGDSPFASPAAAPRAPHQRRSSNGQPQAGPHPPPSLCTAQCLLLVYPMG